MVARALLWHTTNTMTGTLKPLSFNPDTTSFAHLFANSNINTHQIGTVLFGIVLFLWVIFTIIAIYHWLRYNYRSVITIPILALHIFISLALISYAWVGMTG